ncbi:P-loop NTPase fold protein [Ruminococcus sp.]|uniref:P-loop NTPase fold protein n=2 Tax=Ruminococcus TaxID=1263 RepID=UPI0025EB0AAE|nr:P-loop NTPase fold protein [Ruminococcus sp.]MBD9051704.1 AAA family ATPase [Ruminococcus sp.]
MNTVDEIRAFISQKENNGALLLTGKWGCGKTFLVNQVINKLNQGNDFIAVSISLFGIDSIELLHNEIKNKVFFSRGFEETQKKSKNIFSRIRNFSVNATDILGESFSIAKSINKALTIRWQDYFNVGQYICCYRKNTKTTDHTTNKKCCNKKEKIVIKKRLVLFFDDFERSKLDRIELMGVINEYSENRKVKVIIIADEEKIARKKTDENKIETNRENDNVNDNDTSIINYENYFNYSEFKEKLISRTLKIEPDYTAVIDSIINSYEETVIGYKDFLIVNKDIIYQLYLESDSDNFRSVKSFIIDYERLHEAWKNSNVSSENEPNMFYNFGAITFGVKMGIYKKEEYGVLSSASKLTKIFVKWNSIYNLKACQDWFLNNVWNKENFISEINQTFKVQSYTADEKFMLFNLWNLEQKDVENGLPKVIENAYKGKLTRDQLIDLMQKIHSLKKFTVSLPCNIDYTKIENGFEIRKKEILDYKINEPKRYTFTEKSQIDKEAYSLYENIENFDITMNTLESKKEFKKYLETTNDKYAYSFRYKLIGCFDKNLMEMFYKRYLQSSNAIKREMGDTLVDISFCDNKYSEHDVTETIANLKELQSRLNDSEQSKNDYITAGINKLFCDKIDSKILEIKQYYK